MVRLIIKLIRTLSLDKIAIFAIMSFLSIVGFTFWENREKLSQLSFYASQGMTISRYVVTWKISEKHEAALRAIVSSDSKIVAGGVFSSNVRYNEIRPVFFYSPDSSLVSSVAFDTQSRFSRTPLFSFAEISNANIIKLINGQFVCGPFADTNLSILYPELNSIFKYACRASIPSYYGYFSGYIAVYLSEAPSKEKQQQLRLVMENLANEIYFKDVVRTQKLEKIETPVRIM
jgi:hypothetical protein